MAQRRKVRDLAKVEGLDFFIRRAAEWGVRNIPANWREMIGSNLPLRLLHDDDVQEGVSSGVAVLTAWSFGLDERAQRLIDSGLQEALEEVGKEAELHPAGTARKTYVRNRMAKLRDDLEKKLTSGESGRNFWDTLASIDPERVLTFWRWFGLQPETKRELLRELGANIVATPERVTMVIDMPGTLRLEELESYFKTAPKTAGPKKGPLESALAKFGIVTDGAEEKVKEFTNDLDDHAKALHKRLDLLDMLD